MFKSALDSVVNALVSTAKSLSNMGNATRSNVTLDSNKKRDPDTEKDSNPANAQLLNLGDAPRITDEVVNAEERRKVFEKAKNYFPDEDNIIFDDRYVITVNHTQGMMGVFYADTELEVDEIFREYSDARMRYARYDQSIDRVTLFRATTLKFEGSEVINYDDNGNVFVTGKNSVRTDLQLTPLENAIFSIGHEVAHRHGIDMNIFAGADHGGGNAAGMIACQNAGMCQ
ncbi:hypothetical protein ACVBE9_06775 [Eionea flava]